MCAHDSALYSNNECATCDRERNDRYRRRRRLGMALLHTVEARGLSGSEAIALLENAAWQTLEDLHKRVNGNRFAAALEAINAADPAELDHAARMDPALYGRAIANLNRLIAMDQA